MSEVHRHENPDQRILTSIEHREEKEEKEEHKGTTNPRVDSVLKSNKCCPPKTSVLCQTSTHLTVICMTIMATYQRMWREGTRSHMEVYYIQVLVVVPGMWKT